MVADCALAAVATARRKANAAGVLGWRDNVRDCQVSEILCYFTEIHFSWPPLLRDIVLRAPSAGFLDGFPVCGALVLVLFKLPAVILLDVALLAMRAGLALTICIGFTAASTCAGI